MPTREHATRPDIEVSSQRQTPQPDAIGADVAAQSMPEGDRAPRFGLPRHILAPRDVLQLQRTMGNRAVSRMLAGNAQHRIVEPAFQERQVEASSRVDAEPPRAEDAGRISPPKHSGSSVVQRAFELCDEADITHTEDHRAKKVEAKNIRGWPLFAAANSPTLAGSPFGWKELNTAGHTLANTSSTSTHYNAVRMHLMNGRLGGPGDKKWNLAPGPAKINSIMSAGPETSAKLLVEAGNSIWLTTEVRYMNNSTNATDFTSVVPNHIDMRWGVMGASASSTWSSDIELPVAPLQGAAAKVYEDWPKSDPAGLVAKLQNETDQVRAQVFDLVQHDDLRFAILMAFPQTYLSMEPITKGRIVAGMSDTILTKFLDTLGVISSPEMLVEEIILPLAAVGGTTRLQGLFAGLGDDVQRKMIIIYKWDLLQHLGAIAEAISKKDWTIFKYNPPAHQVNLLRGMDASAMTTFLGARTKIERKQLFNAWAEAEHKGLPDEKATFVAGIPTVADKFKTEYKREMDNELRSIAARLKRPTRSTTAKPGKVSNTKVVNGGVKKRQKTKL